MMNKHSLYQRILLVTIALFLLPSINLGFVYSHGIAKLTTVFLLLTALPGFKPVLKKHTIEYFLILLFLIAHSLSIINVVSVSDFLRRYSDFVIPLAIFFIVRNELSGRDSFRRNILVTMVATFTINTILEFFILVTPSLFLSFASLFLHPLYITYIDANIQRDRIFFASYNESLFPVVLFLISQSKPKIQWPLVAVFFIRSFITIVGKFRSNFLMMALSIGGTAFVFIQKKNTARSPFLLFAAILIASVLIFSFSSYSVFDRILLTEAADFSTVEARVQSIGESLSFARTYIFGAGLGNYSYQVNRAYIYTRNPQIREIATVDSIPHNFFLEKGVETGFFGLICSVLLIGYFFIQDIPAFLKKRDEEQVIIVAFWSLFSYALFNPSYNVTWTTLFFLFRALIV